MTKAKDQEFWENKWSTNETPWDIGMPSPAICNFIDQYDDKKAMILIPGCGNAHEAAYLLHKGFKNITLLDISATAVSNIKDRFAQHPEVKILQGDFFEHQAQYDLIIEQTFFCAIHPKLRADYARKMFALLKEGGTLAGLLFNRTFDTDGPPFGGSEGEYKAIFGKYFNLLTMENTNWSILPRKGKELFFIFNKK